MRGNYGMHGMDHGRGDSMGYGPHGMHGGFGLARRGFVGLKYWILNFISKKEMTGAQIMDALEELSMGNWRPSPGHVYPALKDLEEDGYIKVREEDNKKFYSITESGKNLLATFTWPMGPMGMRFEKLSRSALEGIDEALDGIESYVDYLEDSVAELGSDKAARSRLERVIARLSSILK
ncbi:MAG: PadR family transcriptional regulator [Candidatus Micrarchaeaceae archaeon]